jgi:hypothetical protein
MTASNPQFAVLASLSNGVDAATTLAVRKAIYAHEPLTPADMALVFEVARRAGPKPLPEWISLFSEAVTDYVVHQNEPRDFIPQDKADWLVAELAKGGGISSKSEFAMLIDIMQSAVGVPASLSAFALREIKTAILTGRRDAHSDEDHPAGVVTAADVEALRAILFAATAGTPGHVSQEEAESLFEIAHAAREVDSAFDDLFARAVANYLMAINMHAPDAAEVLHRQRWLDEEESLPGFMSKMLHGATGCNSFDVLQSPHDAFEADIAAREAQDDALRRESEKVTEGEAAWAIAHLSREGELTSGEKRLLQFLGAEAQSIAPALRALVDKAAKTSVPKISLRA